MNTDTLIQNTKKLRIKDKKRLIIENLKDLNDTEDIEDALDIIKSKHENKIPWEKAKEILKTLNKI